MHSIVKIKKNLFKLLNLFDFSVEPLSFRLVKNLIKDELNKNL